MLVYVRLKKMNDWVYLADKTKQGAELMLIPEHAPNLKRRRKLTKLSLDILFVLLRLYFG